MASELRSAHVDTFTHDNLPARDSWPELRFTLPELRYPPVLNCVDALLDRWVASGEGARRCVLGEREDWTYAELAARASQIAHVLTEEQGLVPGGRVLLRAPNEPWLAACWFGVLKAGGVVVTTMPLLRRTELRTIVEMAEVDLALCDARFLEDLEAAGAPELRIVPFGGGGPDDLVARCEAKPPTFPTVPTAADDVCMLAFTSGTTGRPKATMHFHRDVLAIADTFSRHLLRPQAGDLFTGTPPLAFTFGLGGLLVFPLHAGAATLLLEQPTPDRLLDALHRHAVTTVFSAPTAYRALTPLLAERPAPALEACVSAGETLPAATWTAFHEATGVRIVDGLGSTEMLHIFVSAAPEEMRAGWTGRGIPGYLAEVQAEDGTPVPDGTPGLLAVRGPTGCRYLRGDRQSTYVRRGWNLTGDVYARDPEGYLRFVSRADDMIISSGYNISGPEVEEALLGHRAVAEVAVVGAPDPERGHIVKAYVVARAGTDPGPELVRQLQDFAKAQIAPYKYPRAIEFVDRLPRTETGKLQRFRLRQEP
ncbi:MAG: AMP-binding protein [Candidatus Dormibacteraeota bacterium]|nr:AMP-binding protein [Candidatus Dormibacteraeota bacterium]MBO0704235.1 AMP-binding protein [Candidatus Dormibacteraeota bacterium]MBO0759953.1 AMP-binding protein [Candidatus Dormibacteraeota bacterium]